MEESILKRARVFYNLRVPWNPARASIVLVYRSYFESRHKRLLRNSVSEIPLPVVRNYWIRRSISDVVRLS